MLRTALITLLIVINLTGYTQTIPASRVTDWSKAGLQDTVPVYSNVADIMSYGGVKDSTAPNNTAFQNALNALGANAGTIYFPPGVYVFTQPVSLPDNVVMKGAGKTSRLYFDLGNTAQNMINIQGSIGSTVWGVVQPAAKNDSTLMLNNTTGLNIGDWVVIYGNDSTLVTSPWAYETVGQIFRITNIQGTTINADHIFRRDYPLSFSAKIKKIQPVKGAGIECLYIERKDTTAVQTVNINIQYAVNCWVTGIESYKTNFAHVGLTDASHILIRSNYFHHSHAYGGSGQGYGVMAQYTTGDCLIENNTFAHLRHSMLVHLGANGNVFGYNYSTDPFWTEPSLPSNAAGDIVCHGNYPYLNLFEGNVIQQIVIDDSHGINGPFNTFFRNRVQLYGILQNTGVPTDSVNYIGNEITNTGLTMGLYSLAGTGHYQFGNNVKGVITPSGTTALQSNSLYLAKAPGFWKTGLNWPDIGTPQPYNQGSIPAKQKWEDSSFTDCTINPKFDRVTAYYLNNSIKVYPNPAHNKIVFDLGTNTTIDDITISLSDLAGRTIKTVHSNGRNGKVEMNTQGLFTGIYFYKLENKTTITLTGRIAIMQ